MAEPESIEVLGLPDFLELFVRAARADSVQHHYGPDPWESRIDHVLALDPERAEFLLDEADKAGAHWAELIAELAPLSETG